MNVAYNQLLEQYLPHIDIVYDRYNMQADYGKNVMGQIRLEIARENYLKAKELYDIVKCEQDTLKRKELKYEMRDFRMEYSKIKKVRWLLLKNSSRLSLNDSNNLDDILNKHKKISICYAMKEEMNRIFNLFSFEEASISWENWFNAARESLIELLVRFANNKLKRIKRLIAHSIHNISTGKLEGLNNKIKVTKRNAYGYRNMEYFFSFLKCLMLPKEYK